MRVGIDARLVYYRQAGISQYIQRLIAELPRLDPAVDWCILQSRREAHAHPFGRRLRTPCHHRFERWALGTELLPLRLDLLHSPDFIPPAWGARRTVITVHDLNFIYYPQFLTQESLRYYSGQIRWAVGRADHILADSHQTKRDLIDQLGVLPEKVTTVHLAADDCFRPLLSPLAALDEYGLSPGYILFVGTLEPRKNIPTLLKAYRQLVDRGSTAVPLVLVGRRGWLSDEIFVTLSALRLEKRVRILENVSQAEMLVSLYNGAGVLAIPSYYEGFGLPALEAMACGTPVVASRRGSLPEIVEDAGLLIEPDDPQALAVALGRALEDKELRAQMIELGLSRAAGFSWRETARQTLRVFRQVLSN